MFRSVSIIIRKIKSGKAAVKILQQFNEWKEELTDKQIQASSSKLLIIRLDDIGDYILFRNFLASYKNSERWKFFSITLLGNIIWKELFDFYDRAAVDNVIWIDKKNYLYDVKYRKTVWNNLRNQHFEAVVCPSRTRPLLIDDLCAIATDASKKIAAYNTTYHTTWNKNSDAVYTDLFRMEDALVHEFYFNKAFAEWVCLTDQSKVKLSLPTTIQRKDEYIICFIGASTNSKKWSEQNWIELVTLLKKTYNCEIIIAGGKNDVGTAAKISTTANVTSVAGKTALTEVVNIIANAEMVICNDTMAVHIAAACNTPTVLIANGNNFYRFADYNGLRENVKTLYPQVFLKKLKHHSKQALKQYVAVTPDISTIQPITVMQAVNTFLETKNII